MSNPGILAPVNAKYFGAKGDGSDDTAAILNADAYAGAGGVLYFPPGNYNLPALGTTYNVKSGWLGAGSGQSTITCPDIATPLKWSGSVGAQINLAADLTEGQLTATLAAGGGANFAVGSSVIFQATSQNYGAWVTHVSSIAGDVLTLQESCPANFTVANGGSAQRITPLLRPLLKDLALIGPVNPTVLSVVATFNYIEGGTIENCRYANGLDVGMALFGCYGTALRNVSHSEMLANNTALGIQVFKSAKMEISGGESHHSSNGLDCEGMTRSTVHGLRITDANTSGGRGIKLLFASNYNTVTACKIASNDPTHTGIHVDDSWGNTITGNELDNIGGNAINLTSTIASGNQTHHNIITNNQIRNCNSYGIAVGTGTNAVDTYNTIEGNSISNGQGGISVNTNSNNIKGNIIDGVGAGAGISLNVSAINNLIEGNIFNCGAQNALLNNTGAGPNFWLNNHIRSGGTSISAAQDVFRAPVGSQQLSAISGGATATPDLRQGSYCYFSVNDATAFAIGVPSKPSQGALLTIDVLNNTAGAIGAIGWNAVFHLAGAFTNPGAGKRRNITFVYNVNVPGWVEIARAVADI